MTEAGTVPDILHGGVWTEWDQGHTTRQLTTDIADLVPPTARIHIYQRIVVVGKVAAM